MKTRDARLVGLLVVSALLGSSAAVADDGGGRTYLVTVTNLTRGQIFGPPLVIAHAASFQLFTLGSPASPGLAIMAEDAGLAVITQELQTNPAVFDISTGAAPLAPGARLTLRVQARRGDRISVAQMLVTTNDAFFAVKGGELPRGRSAQVFYADAYDAGSEFNSESCVFVPGPPCGAGLVRDTAGAEGYVYVHNGIHGVGNLDLAVLDWRNPVAKVTVVGADERR